MSSSKQSWVVATITTIVMALAGLVIVPAVHAAPGDPIIPTTPTCTVTLTSGDPATAPPPPTCYDPSGADLDEVLVPYYVDTQGYEVPYVDADMDPLYHDRPNSSYGASQMQVSVKGYDPAQGFYVITHTWTLSFGTGVTYEPTPNTYWVELGECKTSGGFTTRLATAYMRNEPGPDGRYIGYVGPGATGDNGNSVFDTQPAYRVLDGATVGMPLVADLPYKLGLDPGTTYTVKFWLEDRNSLPASAGANSRVGGQVRVYVPKCGSDTSTPGTGSVEPRAKIKIIKRGPVFSKVKVVLGSRKATTPTKYKVIRDPKHGRTLRKTYDTKFKVVKYYKIRKGTVVKVRFKTVLAKRRI